MSCFTEASAGFRNLRESREKTAGFRRYCFHTLELAGPHNRNRTREINGDTDDFASPKKCDPRYVLLVQNAVSVPRTRFSFRNFSRPGDFSKSAFFSMLEIIFFHTQQTESTDTGSDPGGSPHTTLIETTAAAAATGMQ